MDAYQELGNSYSQNRKYEDAIKCYKKLMIYSWKTKDKASELQAYTGMAL
jgi:pentatricopeptide repeat protein